MKTKIFIASVLITLSSITAGAQSVHVGGKFGANISKIDGQSFNDGFNFGYHAGVFAEIGFNKDWGIDPEILFSQITAKPAANIGGTVPQFNDITHLHLSYLTIPVLFEYKLSKFVAVQLGPQFGILIDHDENLSQNASNAFSQGDISALGGLQFSISSFRFYGRYVLGINNINNNTGDGSAWRKQGFQIGIGYAFF
ncbi:porin family protein [Ferruginibacter albus]|uniref:porin family protein n=1 Tax=Ferruginibacter albus TaxID=2875540 RepID=UPI001CC591B4|nr:porin family protein [Ferruginibacter albus]UAY52823.1 PorT family protein [Ferruginibacter albus]